MIPQTPGSGGPVAQKLAEGSMSYFTNRKALLRASSAIP